MAVTDSKQATGSNGSGPGASLDVMLTDAARGPSSRWFPGRAGLEVGARLAARPDRVARRGLGLAAELAKIAAGRSDVAPEKGDRRFKDPAWSGNPAFRMLMQSYLASSSAVADGLVQDAGAGWQSERRVRFTVENLVGALAPSNFPALNPTVYKATLDSGGRNLAKGLRQLAGDMRSAPRIPTMVDRSGARAPAADHPADDQQVLHRRPRAGAQHGRVLRRPGPAGVLDVLAQPGRTPCRLDARHLRAGGARCARRRRGDHRRRCDPDARAVRRRHRALLGGRAPRRHRRARSARAGLTLGVCVLDTQRAGTTSALVDQGTAALAIADSARKGYLDGKEPPAFDILYWNADSTRMPAGLHRDFIELSLENKLVTPGALELLGTPVDLSRITVDTYVVAGIADHITPWQSAYRSTQLLGSEPRFVLSTSGHIAALVNPPGNEKASFQTRDDGANPESSKAWLEAASAKRGTWWSDWAAWLAERSGAEKPAPAQLGDADHEPVGVAPGEYVLVK